MFSSLYAAVTDCSHTSQRLLLPGFKLYLCSWYACNTREMWVHPKWLQSWPRKSPRTCLLKVKNYTFMHFKLKEMNLYLPRGGVCRKCLCLQSPSIKLCLWLGKCGRGVCVCCVLEASAESVSAVFMLCQGETLGRRLLRQSFLLFDKTMKAGC